MQPLRKLQDDTGQYLLSVSSVGSEAMQRGAARGGGWDGLPFSILGRIGGDATASIHSGPEIDPRFQYPRSDRRRCNSPCGRCNSSPHQLSVSSVGSEAMQLSDDSLLVKVVPVLSVSSVGSEAMQLADGDFTVIGAWLAFSILGRIGGDATEGGPPPSLPHLHFQYPRSDRRRCNSV